MVKLSMGGSQLSIEAAKYSRTSMARTPLEP